MIVSYELTYFLASESTQICVTRVSILPLLFCNFDDQLSPNVHRFVICWDTPSDNGLWQSKGVRLLMLLVREMISLCSPFLYNIEICNSQIKRHSIKIDSHFCITMCLVAIGQLFNYPSYKIQ